MYLIVAFFFHQYFSTPLASNTCFLVMSTRGKVLGWNFGWNFGCLFLGFLRNISRIWEMISIAFKSFSSSCFLNLKQNFEISESLNLEHPWNILKSLHRFETWRPSRVPSLSSASISSSSEFTGESSRKMPVTSKPRSSLASGSAGSKGKGSTKRTTKKKQTLKSYQQLKCIIIARKSKVCFDRWSEDRWNCVESF